MYENPSSIFAIMKVTLETVQKVRTILESEVDSLSPNSYSEMERHLSAIEAGLCKELGEVSANQYTEPPSLYDDDDEGFAGIDLWHRLLEKVTGR